MRSLSMPPSGRTNSCAADSDNPDIPAADKKKLETPERLPKSAALHSRLSALFKSSASAATLALYMTAGADIANAQFICQQYGGSFGGATAGSLAIACGTNANASATGSTAFGNLTAASVLNGRRQRCKGKRRQRNSTWRLRIVVGIRRGRHWRV